MSKDIRPGLEIAIQYIDVRLANGNLAGARTELTTLAEELRRREQVETLQAINENNKLGQAAVDGLIQIKKDFDDSHGGKDGPGS